jgi:hypothetical protein
MSNGKKGIIIVKSVTKFNLLDSLMKTRILFGLGDGSSEKTGSLKMRKGCLSEVTESLSGMEIRSSNFFGFGGKP